MSDSVHQNSSSIKSTLFVIDTNIEDDKKSQIIQNLNSKCILVEINRNSDTYDSIKTKIYNLYQEKEILSGELELSEIIFFNDDLECQSVFTSYSNAEPKLIIDDMSVLDENNKSWNGFISFLTSLQSEYNLDAITFLDINHIVFMEKYTKIFSKIESAILENNNESHSTVLTHMCHYNTSWDNALYETESKKLHDNSSSNWIHSIYESQLFNTFAQSIVDKAFQSNTSSLLTRFKSESTVVHFSMNSKYSSETKVVLIPLYHYGKNKNYNNFVDILSKMNSNQDTLCLMLHDDESISSLSQHYATKLQNYLSDTNFDISSSSEMIEFIVYLPPLWNDGESPSTEVIFSSSMATIPLIGLNVENDLSQSQVFDAVFQLIKSVQPNVGKINFEITNMTRNYNQSLDKIYESLTSMDQYKDLSTFRFSYWYNFDGDISNNVYGYDLNNAMNTIIYNNGNKEYLHGQPSNMLTNILGISILSDIEKIIEPVRVHNIVLYDTMHDEHINEVLTSITPNTIIVTFDKIDDTISSITQRLQSVSELPNVELKNISLFQESSVEEKDTFQDDYSFTSDKLHTVYNVQTRDPELSSWVDFIDFCKFLQDDLKIENFDMLLCKLYSDADWNYILTKIESQMTTMNIRSSDDNTGHVMFDGDWTLESEELYVNLIRLYFTESIRDVEIELGHTRAQANLIVGTDGYIYFVGRNLSDMGTGDQVNSEYFALSDDMNDMETDEKFILVAHSDKATLAYTNKNHLFITGTHTYGLGGGSKLWLRFDNRQSGVTNGDVTFLENRTVVAMTATHTASFFILLDDGTLWGYGRNLNGNFANGQSGVTVNQFTQISTPNDEKVKQISTSCLDATIILTQDNNIYTVGRNDNGYCGNGTLTNPQTSWQTPALSLNEGETVIQVNSGTIVLTSEGRVFATGMEQSWEYFNGTSQRHTAFFEISLNGLNSTEKVIYAAKTEFSCFLYTDEGNLYASGTLSKNFFTATNSGTTTSAFAACVFTHTLIGNPICIDKRRNSVILLTDEGYCYVSGSNSYKQTSYQSSITSWHRAQTGEGVYFGTVASIANQDSFQVTESSGGGSTASNNVVPLTHTFTITQDNGVDVLKLSDSDVSYSDISNSFANGVYKITDISASYPLAILNNGESNIQYEGTTLSSTSTGPDGNSYKFYTGTMYIYISGSFTNPLSIYTTNGGGSYLGTQNKIIYDETVTVNAEKLSSDSITLTNFEFTGISMEMTYDSSGNAVHGLSTDASGIVYSNATYTFSTPGIYTINVDLPRYYYRFEADDGVITSGTDYYTYGGKDYYRGDIQLKLFDESNIDASLCVYDSIANSVQDYASFLQYSFSKDTNSESSLVAPFVFDSSRFETTFKTFNVIDLSPSFEEIGHSYSQGINYNIEEGITYVFKAPTSTPIALIATGSQTDISYGGKNQNGSLTVDNVTYTSYDTHVYFKLSNALVDNYVSIFTNENDELNTFGRLIYTASSSLTIDTTSSNNIELSSTIDNEIHFYDKEDDILIPYVLNTDSEVESSTIYTQTTITGASGESYRLISIPPWYPITVLNDGYTEYITIEGDTDKSSTADVSGVTYTFYHGDISINILQGHADGFTLHTTYNGGMNVGGTNAIKINEVECLNSSTSVSVENDKILLNDSTVYNEYKKYGLYDGAYTITGISNEYPLALLNNDVSNVVTYTGTTSEGFEQIDGISYEFYSGTMTIEVTGDFTATQSHLSLYSKSNGYLGANDIFLYATKCESSGAPIISSVCLNTSSYSKVSLQSDGTSKYIFNYESGTTYDSELHYGLNVGNYRILDVPSEYPIALFNHDISDVLTYSGTTFAGSKFSIKYGKSFDYYSGTIYITLTGIPTDVSAISYGSNLSDELFEEDKIIFDTDCVSDGSYVECLSSSITVSSSNDNIILNSSTFTNSKLPGFHDGYYTFSNVDSATPIAFVGSDDSTFSYTGISYKESSHDIDASNSNISFYYGDVELNIISEFSDLTMYVYEDGAFKSQSLSYTDFCTDYGSSASSAKSITCLNSSDYMNVVTSNGKKIVMNGGSTYDSSVMYGIFYGMYEILNVSANNALRISQSDIDASLVYLESDNKIVSTVDDVSHNFYYGTVRLYIKQDLSSLGSDLRLSSIGSDISMEDLFVWSDSCESSTSYYVECLDTESSVSVDNGYYLLNNATSYSEYRKIGLHIGNYTLNNIPTSHPIAILNHDVSDALVYSGETLEGTKDVDGVTYSFYSGSVDIVVKSDFTTGSTYLSAGQSNNFVSIYCFNHGYMGGENILMFTNICEDPSGGYYIDCLNSTTTFNLDSSNQILLNNDTKYNSYQKYGVSVGTYTIQSVPLSNPITIFSDMTSDQMRISGTEYGTKTVDGELHTYYTGDVTMKLYEDISYSGENAINILSYSDDDYQGMLGKIIINNDCGNLDDESFTYLICLDQDNNVNTYFVDGSVNYAFNNGTDFFSYKRYGMHVGNYILRNIAISAPFALLNHDVSNSIVYTGSDSKKATMTGPDGHTYDFYYGDVEITVYGDFGTISAYSGAGHYAGTQNAFVFSDVCELDGLVTQCLTLETVFNKYGSNFTLNGSSSYNQYINFGVTIGTYTITNIPSNEAIGLITNDISDSVLYYGASSDLCGNFVGPDGNNYDFYTNKLHIIVKSEFDGFIKMYSHADQNYNNGESLIKFTTLCDSINSSQTFTRCLDSSKVSTVSLVDSSYIILDSSFSTYNAKRKYGVYNGTYILDVSENYPIAFFNDGKEDKIIYQGLDSNKTSTADPTGSTIYDYYHGKVTLTVMGDFGTISYHIKNNGYMGGENAIIYTDKCELEEVSFVVECLDASSNMNIVDVDGTNHYSMNSNSTVNSFKKFGLYNGNYTISDICDNYPIAIVNHGKSELISYNGSDQDLCGNFTAPDGNTYPFYKNSIDVTVNGDFSSDISGMSIYVYGDVSGYYGLEEKLVYSDTCEDTTVAEYESADDNITLISFNSYGYTTYNIYGNSSYFI